MGNTGLPKDWLVRPALDPELKRYLLLAYLQRVNTNFAERKLYPYLDDLRSHVEELLRLRRSKEELARNITGPLIGFDPRTGTAIHEQVEDELLALVDEILDFSIPGLNNAFAQGEELRQEIAEKILLWPIGVQPLKPNEGWLLLRTGNAARVYSYAMPLLHMGAADRYRSVRTRYVTTYSVGITCTYEHIKAELRSQHSERPNAATFVFEIDMQIPHIETFMPLAKQLVYDHIAGAA